MSASEAGERLRIVVLGYVVRAGMGGMAWHYLHYVLGLARMGHEVRYVEDSGDETWACYDPQRDVTDTDPTYGLEFMDRSLKALGIGNVWAYYDAHQDRWHGPGADAAPTFCGDADLILNVSGANVLRSWFDDVDKRVFIDTDPAFTQIRNLTDPEFKARTAMHNVFFSFGESIGGGRCRIPDDGFPWRKTRQPVVLDAWPVESAPPDAPFSTVMQWSAKNAREYEGIRYGAKEDSLAPFATFPRAVHYPLELALGGRDAPRADLQGAGWRLRDPREVASGVLAYQSYIRASRGEFSVAKQGYVVSRSGWFSERSACYLASGRPVVTQETGFSDHLPTDRGLLTYSSLDEAREALARVGSDHEMHCKAAREIAATCFDHERVLKDLVDHAR